MLGPISATLKVNLHFRGFENSNSWVVGEWEIKGKDEIKCLGSVSGKHLPPEKDKCILALTSLCWRDGHYSSKTYFLMWCFDDNSGECWQTRYFKISYGYSKSWELITKKAKGYTHIIQWPHVPWPDYKHLHLYCFSNHLFCVLH